MSAPRAQYAAGDGGHRRVQRELATWARDGWTVPLWAETLWCMVNDDADLHEVHKAVAALVERGTLREVVADGRRRYLPGDRLEPARSDAPPADAAPTTPPLPALTVHDVGMLAAIQGVLAMPGRFVADSPFEDAANIVQIARQVVDTWMAQRQQR